MTKKPADFATEWQANWTKMAEKFAAIQMDNAQKCFDVQMGMFQAYSDLAMGNLKAVTDIKEPQDLVEVFKRQAEELKTVGEKSVADLTELAKTNAAMGQEMQALWQEVAEKAMPKAA